MRHLIYLLCLLPGLLTAQTGAITGRVVDAETDQPLVGATVRLKGYKVQEVTDLDGAFSLSPTASFGRGVVVITYIGYEELNLRVGAGDSLGTIRLAAATEVLEEVVITGYAAQRRRDVTGSVNSMRALSPAFQDYDRPERYSPISENGWIVTKKQAISTLSTDVDRASYANVRRFIEDGSRPPAGAVRSEEMINYFAYDDPAPSGTDVLALRSETSICPWNPDNRLLRLSVRAQDIPRGKLPPANLVFLLDVSGSMQGSDRLDLLKQSLYMLVDQLRAEDRVSIVVYAGSAGLVLPPTPGDRGSEIRRAIAQLEAGGSTAGEMGIRLAYATAREYFLPEGNNRIILGTDGDFNVGMNSEKELIELIEKEREGGIFLTVLGFGRGNYQEGTMQLLADRGNGNHAYIDGILEAKKTLINEFGGTLVTVAKDVKVQVEFDPAAVTGYRLIGYENRLLETEDFENDKKDAAELGAGHHVTVLYEYRPETTATAGPIGAFRLRYKSPRGGASRLVTQPILSTGGRPSTDLRWAAAVAEFAMLLRDSPHRGRANYRDCLARARSARGEDHQGYRAEMIGLMERAVELDGK